MFDLVKNIYYKQGLNENYEQFEANYVFSFLVTDKYLLDYCRNMVSLLYHIDPTHFMYLLYYTIPASRNIPYFKKTKQKEPKEEKELQEIAKMFYWTKKEIELYKGLL